MRRFVAPLLALAALLFAAPSAADLPDPAPCGGCWSPAPTTKPWQWQLQGKIDLSVQAPVYDIDMDVGGGNVSGIHAQHDRAICYVDVGSWEPYRSDAGRFPKRILGHHFPGFPEERWLDIRALGVLKPIMRKRFDTCASKGFDAVEPDNVEGYANNTGFPLSAKDQLHFNTWVANAVHARGMAVGLKNDLGGSRGSFPTSTSRSTSSASSTTSAACWSGSSTPASPSTAPSTSCRCRSSARSRSIAASRRFASTTACGPTAGPVPRHRGGGRAARSVAPRGSGAL